MPDGTKMTTVTDEQLVLSTLRGNVASFGSIVER